jgi:2-amino-4-hydroxy-6-hydroxymethyldihydropteridine diphosphokinase
MNIAEWYPYYLKIASDLNLDIKKDILSSLFLSNLISNNLPYFKDFKNLNNKKVLIIGAGPSLEESLIQRFIKENSRSIIISADGSTELCLKINIIPDFIVTDLDGDIDSLLIANRLGSTVLIHSHGDNIEKILKLAPKFKNFFGTTQALPLQNVYNFGGFTDGDRCAFFADEFHCKEIWLLGMDFVFPIGYYSKKMKFNFKLKKKKLSIGKQLLEILAKRSNSLFINVTTFKFNSIINGIIDYKLK